jgi:hypothetical protein
VTSRARWPYSGQMYSGSSAAASSATGTGSLACKHVPWHVEREKILRAVNMKSDTGSDFKYMRTVRPSEISWKKCVSGKGSAHIVSRTRQRVSDLGYDD